MNKIELTEIIQPKYAHENLIVPKRLHNNVLYITCEETQPTAAIVDDLEFSTGLKIKIEKVSLSEITKNLETLYPDYIEEMDCSEITQLLNHAIEDSSIELLNLIINKSMEFKSSDIHIEPCENKYRIRFRIDGKLRVISNMPVHHGLALVSRIKVLSKLDISEKRQPQDGKIIHSMEQGYLDIRVSTLPAYFGEKAVLRLLDKNQIDLSVESLGMNKRQIDLFKEKISLPYGIILVTGPTGSGKSTTLYSALKEISNDTNNILTIEDPIEYSLDGINQTNVKPEIGFNFAKALRAFLRQDPDVIMVGEIRDQETAEISIRAALTGHLVFSTLHTNDSIAGITRLIEMGIEPFLVAASLKLMIAQRLIRKLCSCKIQNTSSFIKEKYPNQIIYKATGCKKCFNTGYSGRLAVFEMLEISEELNNLITSSNDINQYKNAALNSGFTSIYNSAEEKLIAGTTSYEEIIRETLL